MHRIRAVAAAALLVVVVGATPAALLVWGRSPTALVTFGRADDGSALLAALTLLGWLAWAAFTASVAVEAVNLVAHRVVPLRLPLLGGVQSVAGALVVAALAPAAAAGATPAPGPSAAAVAPPAVVDAVPDLGTGAAATDSSSYLVRPGDDLWSIAEQLLGDGRHWRRLTEANPGLLVTPTVDLTAGTRLRLPAEATAGATERAEAAAGSRLAAHHSGGEAASPAAEKASAAPRQAPAAKARTVTVQRGDTLSGLAEQHLGTAARWPRIYRANADRIDDPDVILVGWKLVLPGSKADSPVSKQSRPPRRTIEQPQADGPDGQQSVPAPSAPATAPPAPPSDVTRPESQSSDPSWPLIGGLGAAAATMILGGVGLSRMQQLRARPLGRRINHPPVDVRRYETALGHRERPDSTALLEKALRHLGAHVHATNRPLPPLNRVLLDEVGVAFHWRQAAGEPPAGFSFLGDAWLLSATAAEALPASSHPVPFPALVTLGRSAEGSWLMVDLESRSPLAIDGPRALRHAAVAAMAVELSCSPWASELRLAVVGGDEVFIQAACPELVRFGTSPGEALADLEALAAERGDDDAAIAMMRVDPDRSEAGAAAVTLFADELEPDERARLDALLGDPDLGLSGVVGGGGGSAMVLTGSESDSAAHLQPDGDPIRPQLIAAHTRAAIGTIFAATDDPDHGRAPWWAERDADNVRTLMPRPTVEVTARQPDSGRPAHPYLMLLGPISMAGAAGPEPARARRQCEEYCAWLLQHPRSTATRMATELVVAETTRRSNMSRLRTWLGADPDGRPYLPEAYSGRIELHPEVSSDWHRLQVLTAPGLNRLAPDSLVSVLELVRGAPLADAAPGQWRWAEELRTDMMSIVRDAGVLLTRWAIEHRDLDLARWAAARALLGAPEDELLLVERIHTEHLAGNTAEVERLVRWVTGQARALGVDLAEETVEACQRAMEGRTRPRAVR